MNDDESAWIQHFEEWLQRLSLEGPDHRHYRTRETNGDAHLKNLLMHHQVLIPVTEGRLDFGPWQQVSYGKFDGQRRKRVVIKTRGDRFFQFRDLLFNFC